MENLIEAIRTALHDDADPIARRAGLVACRKILAVLEAVTADERATSADAMPTSAPAAASANAPDAAPASPSAASASTAAPRAAAPAGPAAAPLIDPATVATVVASLGKLPPEQLLDLAIARLRAALPAGTAVQAPSPLRFQLIPLHRLERSK
jgi:hypothetical protein